jgi:hypothetical protein
MSNVTHEIRIITSDPTKVIRFRGKDAPSLFVDLCNSCALVNGDREPDQTNEAGVLVGTIQVKERYERVLQIIENEAGLCTPVTLSALAAPEPITIVERFD